MSFWLSMPKIANVKLNYCIVDPPSSGFYDDEFLLTFKIISKCQVQFRRKNIVCGKKFPHLLGEQLLLIIKIYKRHCSYWGIFYQSDKLSKRHCSKYSITIYLPLRAQFYLISRFKKLFDLAISSQIPNNEKCSIGFQSRFWILDHSHFSTIRSFELISTLKSPSSAYANDTVR